MEQTMSEQLLELMIALLEDQDEPVHYKMLTEAIIDSGIELSEFYKRPSDSIYGILTGGIKKGSTRYVFMGQGIFAKSKLLSDVEELIVVPKNPVNSKPKAKVRKLPMLIGEATHRDCIYFFQTDLQLAAPVEDNHYGTCTNGSSQKIYPHKMGPVCEFFVQKDIYQIESEHKRRLKLLAIIDGINAVCAKNIKNNTRSEYTGTRSKI